MELLLEERVHLVFALHCICDDKTVCSYKGARKGMETWWLLLWRLADCGTLGYNDVPRMETVVSHGNAVVLFHYT